MNVQLQRLQSGDQGTFGRIVTPGGLILFTGELPERDNQSDVSCISAGTYDAMWAWSDHFRRMMYLLLGTNPRAGIRAHAANFMGDATKGYKKQLNGCIALGEKVGVMDGQKALLVSAPAVRRFESHMQYKSFTLEVVSCY
jgi:hypothetical protein